MTVGVPGFVCALLVARLADPVRPPARLTVRSFLRDFHIGAVALVRQLWPLLVCGLIGVVAAYRLDRVYGADSKLDVAAFSAAIGLGLTFTIWRLVRRTPARRRRQRVRHGHQRRVRRHRGRGQDGAAHPDAGVRLPGRGHDLVRAQRHRGLGADLRGPRARASPLRRAASLLGKWGLIAGTAGTLFGGCLADWLRRRNEMGRVLTVGLGLLLGGPLAVWLLTIRDPDLFQVVFTAAFFCLSWYNGPITAVIFDVVPPRISATVAGAYLLFIHLAGDAIALPLVGTLSDQFGLDRAILLLPSVVIVGGVVVLFATRTVRQDMAGSNRPRSGWRACPDLGAEVAPHCPDLVVGHPAGAYPGHLLGVEHRCRRAGAPPVSARKKSASVQACEPLAVDRRRIGIGVALECHAMAAAAAAHGGEILAVLRP